MSVGDDGLDTCTNSPPAVRVSVLEHAELGLAKGATISKRKITSM